MDTLDRTIPDPARDFASPFLMPIEDVFTIGGRGTVVTGRVQRGVLARGASVEVVGLLDESARSRAGENVGLLLRGVKRDEVVRGQVLTAPGVVRPRVAGVAEVYLLSQKEGGRHTPVRSGYRPQFFFGSTDVTGEIELTGDVGIDPGAHAKIGFRLIHPVGIEAGMRFALREGGKTVGAGVITAVQ